MANLDTSELQRLIEERRREVEERKSQIEELRRKRAVEPLPATTQLLEDVLTEIHHVAAAPLPPKSQLAPESKPTSKQKSDRPVRTLPGRALTVVRTEDVMITPLVISNFEKSIQVDVEPAAPEEPVLATASFEIRETKPMPPGGRPPAVETAGSRPQFVPAPSAPMAAPAAPTEPPESARPPPSELDDERKEVLLTTPEFADAFTKTSRLVERALGTGGKLDIFADYSGEREADELEGEGVAEVKLIDTYKSQKWTRNRSVTSIGNSPEFPELFLASYGARTDASIADPDGCVLVWSLPMGMRPEYTFTCQSALCSALFDPFQPKLILGGTYTGSIVLWDLRAKSRPVQRTSLSREAHGHPLYSLQIIGTRHAHNLVSVDTDGKLCLWSVLMLSQPTESLQLKRGNRDLSCQAVAFADGETNVFVGGAEDGSLFEGHIHGSKVGVTEVYEASHLGPVTSLHWHPAVEGQSYDATDLLLSTSVDWTSQLWCPKLSHRSLHSFEASDGYVMDARWHPTHPGVFASVDSEGSADIWDISKDLEVPIVRTPMESSLNRVMWSDDGRRVMVGDTMGDVQVYGVSHDVWAPRAEDWTRLEDKVEGLKGEAEKSKGLSPGDQL